MNNSFNPAMKDALRLMRAGDLTAATLAIRQGLGGLADFVPSASETSVGPGIAGRAPAPIDAEFRVIDEPTPGGSHFVPGADARVADSAEKIGSRFLRETFTCAAGARDYKLFIPASHRGRPMPLLVMLHGCTQTADDFARGTRMNALAEERGCFVLYPEQAQRHNGASCWNWFKPGDQRRDAGEPSIIAGLTRAIVTQYGLDPTRVHAAGLSAGAAMAVVLGRVYPDLYAAVGVHSGLPYGAAHDAQSAFAVMHRIDPGPSKTPHAAPALGTTIPTIVFHGDRDTTVHPCNGHEVTAQSMPGSALQGPASEAPESGNIEVEQGRSRGGRSYTRTVFRSVGGESLVEQWVIHGAGHAWSGGDRRGSFTDPAGPDASSEMLRFFAAHALHSRR